MEFSNTSNKSGIIQDCEFWLFSGNYGQISGDTNMINTFTSLVNRAYDSVVTTILDADDRWNFDDTAYTDFPIATTNIVSGQTDYELSVDHLKVLRVECQDGNGNWVLLKPIDLFEDVQVARDEFMSGGGIPIWYDKQATSLFLYPVPNYNVTGGLRVYYQRQPDYFTNADTTKKPGFVTMLHRLVPMKACYDFAIANNLTDKIRVLDTEIQKKEFELKKFYGRRNKDETPKLMEKYRGSFYGEPMY